MIKIIIIMQTITDIPAKEINNYLNDFHAQDTYKIRNKITYGPIKYGSVVEIKKQEVKQTNLLSNITPYSVQGTLSVPVAPNGGTSFFPVDVPWQVSMDDYRINAVSAGTSLAVGLNPTAVSVLNNNSSTVNLRFLDQIQELWMPTNIDLNMISFLGKELEVGLLKDTTSANWGPTSNSTVYNAFTQYLFCQPKKIGLKATLWEVDHQGNKTPCSATWYMDTMGEWAYKNRIQSGNDLKLVGQTAQAYARADQRCTNGMLRRWDRPTWRGNSFEFHLEPKLEGRGKYQFKTQEIMKMTRTCPTASICSLWNTMEANATAVAPFYQTNATPAVNASYGVLTQNTFNHGIGTPGNAAFDGAANVKIPTNLSNLNWGNVWCAPDIVKIDHDLMTKTLNSQVAAYFVGAQSIQWGAIVATSEGIQWNVWKGGPLVPAIENAFLAIQQLTEFYLEIEYYSDWRVWERYDMATPQVAPAILALRDVSELMDDKINDLEPGPFFKAAEFKANIEKKKKRPPTKRLVIKKHEDVVTV